MNDLTPMHLRNGTEAFVVPLLPVNREALRQEYQRLSAETRFDRFLAAVPKLTDTMLDHLVDEVDGTELPQGLARIIRYPNDPTTADIAVTVVDDWHGRATRRSRPSEPRRQHSPRAQPSRDTHPDGTGKPTSATRFDRAPCIPRSDDVSRRRQGGRTHLEVVSCE